MVSKSKKDFIPQADPEHAPPCNVVGCLEPGGYKAPKSRDELGHYQWLCLEHIRQYNSQWDYFAGSSADEIESFVRDAVTGHRPTWSRESRVRERYHKLQDALYEFMAGGPQVKNPKAPPSMSGKLRRAMAAMDVEYPFTEQSLKVQYRALVKKYHPDVNKGDKKAEETFKQISTAYAMLLEYLKSS